MIAALLVIATAFWGQTPACGTPTVVERDLTWPVIGLAAPADCLITLNRSRSRGPGRDCMIYLHEYGHLLGEVHSADPDDIMYPVQDEPRWPCKW